MSDQPVPPPDSRRAARRPAQRGDNPGKQTKPGGRAALGVALALLSVPLAVALLAAATLVAGVYGGFVAALIPYAVSGLYRLGAGRAARIPIISVSIVAILCGALAAGATRSFLAYQSVGGEGGLGSPVFWSTFVRQLTSNTETLVVVLLAIGFGLVGLIVVRLPNAPPPGKPAAPQPPRYEDEPFDQDKH